MKAKQPKHSIQQLRNALEYDANSGLFHWKVNVSRKFRIGSVAGTKKDARGYLSICYERTRYYAHRLAWALYYGEWFTADVDHINLNKSDNRISNLRLATRSQNIAFKPVRSGSKSKRKGVYYDKRYNTFSAYLDTKRGRVHLGTFAKLDDADRARQIAERNYWKEFSWPR